MSLFVNMNPVSYIAFILFVYFSFIYCIQYTVICYVLLVTCSLTFLFLSFNLTTLYQVWFAVWQTSVLL